MGIDWRIHFFDSTGFKYLNELTNCFCQHSQHSPTQWETRESLGGKRRWRHKRRRRPKETHKKRKRTRSQDWMETTSSTPLSLVPTGALPRPNNTGLAVLAAAAAAAVSRNAPFYEYISLFSFGFFFFFSFSFSFLFFFSFFHSLTFPNVNTPWRDATTPASSLYLYPRCLE